MNIYQPYTYLIGWSNLNKWYYGVRFADYSKNDLANPSELWTTYFTSSKHVQSFRLEHGEPDVVQIRKIFHDKQSAREWEHKVLRRMHVTEREDFLNKSDAISIPSQLGILKPPGHGIKVGNFHRGRKRSDKTRQLISAAANNRPPPTEETKKKTSQSCKQWYETNKSWNAGKNGYSKKGKGITTTLGHFDSISAAVRAHGVSRYKVEKYFVI